LPKIIRHFEKKLKKVPRWSREFFQNSSHFEEESYEIVKIFVFGRIWGRFLAFLFLKSSYLAEK